MLKTRRHISSVHCFHLTPQHAKPSAIDHAGSVSAQKLDSQHSKGHIAAVSLQLHELCFPLLTECTIQELGFGRSCGARGGAIVERKFCAEVGGKATPPRRAGGGVGDDPPVQQCVHAAHAWGPHHPRQAVPTCMCTCLLLLICQGTLQMLQRGTALSLIQPFHVQLHPQPLINFFVITFC